MSFHEHISIYQYIPTSTTLLLALPNTNIQYVFLPQSSTKQALTFLPNTRRRIHLQYLHLPPKHVSAVAQTLDTSVGIPPSLSDHLANDISPLKPDGTGTA